MGKTSKDFSAFVRLFHNLLASVTETRVTSLATGAALNEFPYNLDNETLDSFQTALHTILGELEQAFKRSTSSGEELRARTKYSEQHIINPLAHNLVTLFFARKLTGQPTENILQVGSLLYAQEIVMLLAHLDAFMADTVRTICVREPRILRRTKKIDWADIIDSGNWETLIDNMVDSYAYEFGWKSIRERVEYLRREHGLQIGFSPEKLKNLDAAENLRHIIIHNGSRVSPEYLARTGRTDVTIGELIPVAAEDAEEVSGLVGGLASNLFRAVAEKYFGISADAVPGMSVGDGSIA